MKFPFTGCGAQSQIRALSWLRRETRQEAQYPGPLAGQLNAPGLSGGGRSRALEDSGLGAGQIRSPQTEQTDVHLLDKLTEDMLVSFVIDIEAAHHAVRSAGIRRV